MSTLLRLALAGALIGGIAYLLRREHDDYEEDFDEWYAIEEIPVVSPVDEFDRTVAPNAPF